MIKSHNNIFYLMSYLCELEFAINTAQKAGAFLMQNFGNENKPIWTAETKETNFKIQMDKESDKILRKEIMNNFPEDDIYSEEAEDIDRGRKRKWVFDPIDGTIPYTMHQNNNWSVAIGLVEDRTPVLGVVYMPERDELYHAFIDGGAFCNGFLVKVSQQKELSKAFMGFDGGKVIPGWWNRGSFAELRSKLESDGGGVAMLYGTGCASVPLCQVASGTPDFRLPGVGRIDGYLGGALEPYDMVAQVPIIREAGGIVTHLNGNEWKFSKLYRGDPTILAANPDLHRTLSSYLGPEINSYYKANPKFLNLENK
ncbi:MAG: inositol monophosphatase [Nanoarchaeota archaeon]|nr:inositol monophosphatase [Nanoarchaeota archaeon]